MVGVSQIVCGGGDERRPQPLTRRSRGQRNTVSISVARGFGAAMHAREDDEPRMKPVVTVWGRRIIRDAPFPPGYRGSLLVCNLRRMFWSGAVGSRSGWTGRVSGTPAVFFPREWRVWRLKEERLKRNGLDRRILGDPTPADSRL